MTAQSVPLLAGDRGTVQTIELIRQAVHAGLSNPLVRATAAQIVAGIPAYNDRAAVEAIFHWVLANIRFTNDPVGHETISSPDWTLTHRIGDCDDLNAVLLPSLLMVVGYPVRLVTISDDPQAPEEFSHIYAEVQLAGQWMPLDAARPGAAFGTTTTRYFRKRIWSLVSREYQDLKGLNGVTLRPGSGLRGFWEDTFPQIIGTAAQGASQVISAIQLPGLPPRPSSQSPSPTPSGGSPFSPALLFGGFAILGAVLLSRGGK